MPEFKGLKVFKSLDDDGEPVAGLPTMRRRWAS